MGFKVLDTQVRFECLSGCETRMIGALFSALRATPQTLAMTEGEYNAANSP